jgi:methionyl-tRNA formyltransferase
MLRIALAAEESAGVQLVRQLAKSGHEVVCVLTKRHGDKVRGATVEGVATTNGLEVLDAERVRDAASGKRLRDEGVDLLLNAHSLFIAAPEVVAAPRIGAFNLHPGPLPRYAGLNGPSWALYHGEREYGVTVHWMEPGIDTGPIAYQTLFPIDEEDTGLGVSTRCIREGVPLMMHLVAQAARRPEGIPRVEQDLSERSYFVRRKVPHRGRLSWAWSAEKLVNLVRAADFHPLPSPWGVPKAMRAGERIGIVKARRTHAPTDADPGTVARDPEARAVRVACADEWVEVALVRRDERSVPAADVLRDGDRLDDAPNPRG